MDDRHFIEQIQTGNEIAFRQLVDTHQRMVVNTCYGLVHDRADAEDLAQEVFIEVFRSASRFRSDSRISTWLYRIAVNKSLNFIRDHQKRKFFQKIEDVFFSRNSSASVSQPFSTDEADTAIQEKQKTAMVHRAIASLPENQRVAFTLNKYEDLSYQEIAEIMELSLSSVESLIHRAKRNLQQKLYRCYKKDC